MFQSLHMYYSMYYWNVCITSRGIFIFDNVIFGIRNSMASLTTEHNNFTAEFYINHKYYVINRRGS